MVQSALEGIVPPDHIYGAECEYDASSGEICAVTKVPAGYGKVAILETLATRLQVSPDRTVYVGDSLMKDVSMAQKAGVIDVHAKYGDTRDSAAYELLTMVSHWTDSDIEKEKSVYSNREVRPSHQITSFNELLQIFHFET